MATYAEEAVRLENLRRWNKTLGHRADVVGLANLKMWSRRPHELGCLGALIFDSQNFTKMIIDAVL
jgi:hypothetical protein